MTESNVNFYELHYPLPDFVVKNQHNKIIIHCHSSIRTQILFFKLLVSILLFHAFLSTLFISILLIENEIKIKKKL